MGVPLPRKALRFTAAGMRGVDRYRDDQMRRQTYMAREQEEAATKRASENLSQRVGEYAKAIQSQDPQQANRIFNEIMSDKTFDATAKQNFAKYHRQVLSKLENPPHPSGMVPQSLPSAAQVVGVQPHTLAVPPPPHV